MTGHIIRRLLLTIPVVLVVAIVIFGILRFTPGDPAAILVGMGAQEEVDPDLYEQIREQLGLNEPLYKQFFEYFYDLVRGDMGQTLFGKHDVAEQIRQRIVPTLSLAIGTEFFVIFVGVPLGVLAAWKANSWIDRVVMVFATLGFSMPIFWLAYLMIFLFAVKLGWFPAAGYTHIGDGVGSWLHHLALPIIATGVIIIALITRMTRATMLEVLREDYVRTAYAKGLGERIVLVRHALRNAALPIATVIGLGIAGLLGGLVVTESVFALPGMGRLLITSIQARDFPIIQGTILIVSFIYILVNMAIDISYAYFDPRIRY